MKKVTVHEAKTNLSKLLVSVEGGEEIIISRGGTPVAKLISVKTDKPKSILEKYQGKIKIANDFDAPLPIHILRHFEK